MGQRREVALKIVSSMVYDIDGKCSWGWSAKIVPEDDMSNEEWKPFVTGPDYEPEPPAF